MFSQVSVSYKVCTVSELHGSYGFIVQISSAVVGEATYVVCRCSCLAHMTSLFT